MAMARKRMKQARAIDTSFASTSDLFRANPKYMRLGYTPQVVKPPVGKEFAEMQRLVHEGSIEVDTMILLDVSASMGFDNGFDQPRHVGASSDKSRVLGHFSRSLPDVVYNILRRAIYRLYILSTCEWIDVKSLRKTWAYEIVFLTRKATVE
jgi:hypothetical protein